mgnify:CR=1 FL=1
MNSAQLGFSWTGQMLGEGGEGERGDQDGRVDWRKACRVDWGVEKESLMCGRQVRVGVDPFKWCSVRAHNARVERTDAAQPHQRAHTAHPNRSPCIAL